MEAAQILEQIRVRRIEPKRLLQLGQDGIATQLAR
jgi:hypothetical protein